MSDGTLSFQPVYTQKTYEYHFYEAKHWEIYDFKGLCCINPIYALCRALALGWRQTCVAYSGE